ncbi:MAG: T9SS type A sorting domain-containing protein [Flavobacteriales bacterium]|nr:T9SS type A sorting domain-containing protein [Flavobacteriales bacterium]
MTGFHGGLADVWVVKLDSGGQLEWQRALGGTQNDFSAAVIQTSDMGFVVAGGTSSSNGDVTSNHGMSDAWVIKLNASGALVWQQTYGGSNVDSAQDIIQTADGGYAVVGTTRSNDGDVSGHQGFGDIWMLRLDPVGVLLWQRTLGSANGEYGNALTASNDGGVVVVGTTTGNGGDVMGHHGEFDMWVVKLDSTGQLQWQLPLGGSMFEEAFAITSTQDGGFAVAGYTDSNDGDVTGGQGGKDYWVVKLEGGGTLQWQRTLGGSGLDIGYAIEERNGGDLLVSGITTSTDGDISLAYGGYDAWLVRLSASGALVWEQSYGGSANDSFSGIELVDGGYCLVGGTFSNDGMVTGHHGGGDVWVVKLVTDMTAVPERAGLEMQFELFPNPTEGEVTIRFGTPQAEVHIEAFDGTGKLVVGKHFTGLGIMPSIDLSGLPRGLYALRIITPDGAATRTVVRH